ncbi:MAG: hypothetical protein AAF721_03315, partial [Myxococcota bacterium]
MCARRDPGAAMATSIKTVHMLSTVNLGLLREYFRGKGVRVPACSACAVALKRAKRMDWLVYVGAGLLAILLASRLGGMSGSSWLIWGAALAIAAPWLVYRTFIRPLPFDTHVWGDEITYEFARAEFAAEFA